MKRMISAGSATLDSLFSTAMMLCRGKSSRHRCGLDPDFAVFTVQGAIRWVPLLQCQAGSMRLRTHRGLEAHGHRSVQRVRRERVLMHALGAAHRLRNGNQEVRGLLVHWAVGLQEDAAVRAHPDWPANRSSAGGHKQKQVCTGCLCTKVYISYDIWTSPHTYTRAATDQAPTACTHLGGRTAKVTHA